MTEVQVETPSKGIVKGAASKLFGFIRVKALLDWSFPFLMVGLGWLSHQLMESITAGSITLPSALENVSQGTVLIVVMAVAVVAQLVLSGVWLAVDIMTAQAFDTPTDDLQMDTRISVLVAMILVGASGYYYALGEFHWWYVVPLVASLSDGFLTIRTSINNAAQKPIVMRGSKGA